MNDDLGAFIFIIRFAHDKYKSNPKLFIRFAHK